MSLPHALVVGGTGMLAGLTRSLAERGHPVTVVARRPAELGPRVSQLELDYRDTEALRRGLAEAVRARGPIELAVAWIHAVAPEAPRTVADAVAAGGLLVHVFGNRVRLLDPAPAHLRYRQVRLGGVREPSGFRWLTDGEISSGVLAALHAAGPIVEVGVAPGPGR